MDEMDEIERDIFEAVWCWLAQFVSEDDAEIIARQLVLPVTQSANTTKERRQLLNNFLAVIRQEEEKERMNQTEKKDGQPLEVNHPSQQGGQAMLQVEWSVTEELMSTPAGLMALRLWRDTDWSKVRSQLQQISWALTADVIDDEMLCEHRWIQVQQELDDRVELDAESRERALELLEQYVSKRVMQ